MSDKITIDLTNLRGLIDKYTREEIAKSIGCDTSLVTKHYSGDRNITLDYAIKYADFFGVSIDYICGRTQNKTVDDELRFVCDYTGLSENAIQKLQVLKGFASVVFKGHYRYFYSCGKFIDFLLQHLDEKSFFNDINNYTNLTDESIEEFEQVLDAKEIDNAREFFASANFKQKVSRACFYDLNEALKDILYAYLTNGSENIEQARSEALNYIYELEKRDNNAND